MDKMRVYDLAKALSVSSRDIIECLDSVGIEVTNAANSITRDQISQVIMSLTTNGSRVPQDLLDLVEHEKNHAYSANKLAKPAKSFHVDPENLSDFLERAREGDLLSLESGDYKGPFSIDKPLTLRGKGHDTVLFAGNEPAVLVSAPGVRFESLSIERTDGGDVGETALECAPGCEPLLCDVRLTGAAPGARFENAIWNLPPLIDLYQLEIGRSHETEITVTVAAECKVSTSTPTLMVTPPVLSPGPANLRVIVRGADAVPGSRMASEIILHGNNGEQQSIKVTAAFVSPVPIVRGDEENDEEDAECFEEVEWGATFERQAAQRFLSKFGRADAQYGDFRDEAVEFLQEIGEYGACLYYLRKRGEGKKYGQEKWELTIATDNSAFPLPPLLAEKNCTLKLAGVVDAGGKDSGLFVLDAAAVDVRRGYRDGFALPLPICFDSYYTSRSTLPDELLEAIRELPDCSECLPTADQLAIWESHVKIERAIAKARQFCVPYTRRNLDSRSTHIFFKLDPESALLSYAESESLPIDEFWRRVTGARNDFIKLVEEDGYVEDRRESTQTLGRIEKVDKNNESLLVKLDEDLLDQLEKGYFTLPKTGWLLFDAYGNIAEVNRKEQALRDLREGRARNPYLGSFFFDPCQARLPEYVPSLEDHELLNPERVNDEQRLTVEKVMASPDLTLVQGPPGTGKTTVIAEICYQVARRGGKTLIASQTNLAVDNAMSRLVHHPIIRALRKGKANKVEDEGKLYLEDRVIGTWLTKTSDHCGRELQRRQEHVDLFRRLLNNENRLKAYIEREERHEIEQRDIRGRLQKLLAEREEIGRLNELDACELDATREIRRQVELTVSSKGSWSEPSLLEIQEKCIQLVLRHPETESFRQSLDVLTDRLKALNVSPSCLPPLALFASAESVRDIAGRAYLEKLNQSELIAQAICHVQEVRIRLEQLTTAETEYAASQRMLAEKQHAVEQAESECSRMARELDEGRHVCSVMTALIPQDGATDWTTSASYRVQSELKSFLEQADEFVRFKGNLQTVVSILRRIGMEIPELPTFSRADRCLRLVVGWSEHFGEDFLHLQRLSALLRESQETITRFGTVQKNHDEQCQILKRSVEDEKDLAEKVISLRNKCDQVTKLQKAFLQWLGDVMQISEQIKRMDAQQKSRLTSAILPPLPEALQQIIRRSESSMMSWAAEMTVQLAEAISLLAGSAKVRLSALDSVKDILLLLDQGFKIVMERNRPAGYFDSMPNKQDANLALLREQATILLNNIRKPLGLLDKFREWVGECSRRRKERDQLVILKNNVETCRSQIPTTDDAERNVEGLVSILSQQGEKWFQSACDYFASQLEAAIEAHQAAQRKLPDLKNSYSEVKEDLKAVLADAHSKFENISSFSKELESVGIVIAMPAGNTESDSVTQLKSAIEVMSTWIRDITELRDCMALIDPDGTCKSILSRLRKDIESQTEALSGYKETLAAALTAQSAARDSVAEHGKSLAGFQAAWEQNKFRQLVGAAPFRGLFANCQALTSMTSGRIDNFPEIVLLSSVLADMKRETADAISASEEVIHSIKTLDPGALLQTIQTSLAERERGYIHAMGMREERLSSVVSPAIAEAEAEIRQMDAVLQEERSWWEKTWAAIPARLRMQFAVENIHDPVFLRQINVNFADWRHELNRESAYLERYEKLVSDWIDRLRTPSERDANDLRSIYIGNANVIGITCSQAATSHFSRDFPEFDVVIIDEVSKCTPPELMIPALKGKKVVLVGDHRQLPPMFEDKTINELAEDIGVSVHDLSFIKTSMFKSFYSRADDLIKQDLRRQYRMHPAIMGAINQFYDGRLKCGIPDPDISRAHGLAGPVLRENQHIVWVSTPLNEENRELKDGTSAYNTSEIDIIEQLCRQMDSAWAPHVANGEKPKEVAVITFYLAQLRRIEGRIRDHDYPNLKIRRGSVDRFQGMERPVVIVSMVRNNPHGDVGFAREPERVNVAFSRAQELLVIVGCRELFVHNARHSRQIYHDVSNHIRRHGGIVDVSAFA